MDEILTTEFDIPSGHSFNTMLIVNAASLASSAERANHFGHRQRRIGKGVYEGGGEGWR